GRRLLNSIVICITIIMIEKKKYSADLEKKRIIFFQIGFIVSFLLTYVAFNSTLKSSKSIESVFTKSDLKFEEIQKLFIEEPKHIEVEIPIEKPKSQKIKIVENKTEIKKDQELNVIPTENNPITTSIADIPLLNKDSIYFVVDELPLFPGGEKGFRVYLSNTIKYPDEAVKNKIQGTVIAQFVVNEMGRPVNFEIVQGSHNLLDEAALDVLKKMPQWQPGKIKGQNVKVCIRVPFYFYLGL
ncbi:MAG: TonB family protein, partial [Bacteroidales bacterium]